MKPIDGGFSPELPHLKKVRPQNTHGHNINNENPTIVKCILIGDEQVGKTSLVVSYTSNGYPDEYKPSALDTYCVEVCADSRPVHLQICDAGGREEVSSLRHLSYLDAHVILLCFSVVRPDTFRSLKTVWLKELASAHIVLNSAAEQTASKLFGFPITNRIVDNYSSSLPTKSKSSIVHSNRGLKNVNEINLIPGPIFLLIGCACDLRNDIGRLLGLSKIGEEPVDKEKAECLAIELGAEAYVECSALTQKNLKTVFDLAIWCGLKVADAGGPLLLREPKPNDSLSYNGNCAKANNENDSITSNNHLMTKSHSSRISSDNCSKYKSYKKGWRRFLCINF
ncbi:Rho-related GTP-binding protein [Schistosoma japonicum]|uniref:Rho-related GTP-binding protein n=2 Tax=Schistosoma japonicum TaxID=6182 RepID=A0A4Z2DEI0_SCHJA|nr:Rho-related GTP-binding protein RhoU [Schistosoma japonicum]TNN14903.1 Rho-related GTP-binding protein [Schistosoma japonicum]